MSSNSAYAPRSLGSADRWGREVQQNQQESQLQIARLQADLARVASRRSALESRVSNLDDTVSRQQEQIQRLLDRLDVVENMARQSELDIRVLRKEILILDD